MKPACAPRWHALLILLVCAAVYWPRLGAEGLRSTEGHRAIPGWEALETGHWLPTTMFDAIYVRKPPGMPWAIAASSMLLDETEFAARFPSAASATLMALIAFAFATRWFGSPWGLVAGLGQALTPRFWSVSRTADIESLLCLGAQIAAFSIITLLLTSPRHRWRWAGLTTLGLSIMLLAKAHAALPVIAGILIAICIIQRSTRALRHPAFLAAVAAALALVAPVAFIQLRAMARQDAVSEEFSKFLWSGALFLRWLSFPFELFASGLPCALALFFPWGKDAASECEADRRELYRLVRTLAIAFLLAGAIYMLAGVNNARYGMPALILLPPLAAYAARGIAEFFTPARARIAHWLTGGSPWTLPVALLAAAAVFITTLEPRDARSSARIPALALAPFLPDGSALWADAWVNAKPELVWYAVQRARAEGRRVTPFWKRREIAAGQLPDDGTFMLLKDSELERFRSSGADPFEVVTTGAADGTPFSLVRVRK